MSERAKPVKKVNPETGEIEEGYIRVSFCGWPNGGCGQEIKWVRTARGKRMPLDPKPCKERGVVELDSAEQVVIRVWPEWRAGEMRERGKRLFNAHFDTCPKHRERQARRDKRDERRRAQLEDATVPADVPSEPPPDPTLF